MNRRILGLVIAGVIGATSSIHAFSISGTAPQVIFNPSNTNIMTSTFKAEIEGKMNAEVSTAFNSTIDTARKNLSGFKSQTELAQGFANANAYSMNSATLQGFQNYSLFAVASGLMVGVQAPSTNMSYYSKIGDEIQKKGDLYAGIGAGFSYANIGINAKFIYPGLYLNAKYGAFSKDIGDFSMDFSVMGLGVNYRLLDTKSLIGLVKWRGVSLGSGFYMQSNTINMKVAPDTIKTKAHFRQAALAGSAPSDTAAKGALLDEMGYTAAHPDANIKLSPEFNMGLDISTMTVPFDAVTAVSVLWGLINVTAGMGIDVNFGNGKIVLEGASKANIAPDSPNSAVTFTDAAVKIDGSSESGPSFARLRAMTGVGIGLGPVKLDIPLIYYFNSGMAFGITGAIVW